MSHFLCLCTCAEVIQQLQLQLLESERRNADYVQRFHKMQTDYCNLTETTAELVDALEATISGKTVGVTVRQSQQNLHNLINGDFHH